ncbi:permease-like cell division protein FtsX [Paenactinomyces guangxiensis]|uniref:Cell division protein FtsX n=1 Tax=Paenactinomyces guangxiensis TaxID=1490290 RepID=A0A7W1WSP7_9BACL|nr:permease-like cell division protein FtsX [Paenactinomyces guangxiensis]MBA4495336.1 ABC transporter permease [Paenactinomyces guangxiensis]MBH8592543.1 ABC transporter permease [Paenactinomyces guangxiensis]
MKIDTMIRHFREAYRGVKRNTWMSFSAISAVAVTLFIFGIFLVFAFNINYMTKELNKQVAIRALVNAQYNAKQQEELTKDIQALPSVKKATFIPKEQGLKQMKASWGEGSEEIFAEMEGEGENPFPDIIAVEPKDPKKIKQVEAEVEKFDGIDDADSGDGVTDRLLNFSGWVQNVVLVFGLGLAVLAAFLISNTIKLTIIARRQEIEIMRLVGASNWFIRWPFFIEGAFIGVMGAIVPIGLVLILYQAALSSLEVGEYSILKLMPMLELGVYVALCIFALGAAIGMSGSIISIRRFLKI